MISESSAIQTWGEKALPAASRKKTLRLTLRLCGSAVKPLADHVAHADVTLRECEVALVFHPPTGRGPAEA